MALKRETVLVRMMDEKELGPNFLANMKHGTVNIYSFQVDSYLLSMSELKNSVSSNPKSFEHLPLNSTRLQQYIDRNSLIECMSTLDDSINALLNQYQIRSMGRKTNEAIHYDRIEDGLKECLKSVGTHKSFQKSRDRMRNYRILRNQFAHFKYGTIGLPKKKFNVESFLEKLDGIELLKAFHSLIDGKQGVMINYEISSPAFLHNFRDESVEFLKMLAETLFPTADKRTYEFN